MAPATWRTGGRALMRSRHACRLRMGVGHRRAHALAEELRHVEGDVGIGVAAGQPLPVAQACAPSRRRSAPRPRGRPAPWGRPSGGRRAGSRPRRTCARAAARGRAPSARPATAPARASGVSKYSKIWVESKSSRSPSISTGTWRLGLMRTTSGCLGSYSVFISKGTMIELEIEALLARRDLGLGAEHAERSGIEFHGASLRGTVLHHHEHGDCRRRHHGASSASPASRCHGRGAVNAPISRSAATPRSSSPP